MVMFRGYPDVVDIKQLCEMLNIGKNTAYELIHSGKLKYVKIGRQIRISKREIIKYTKR